MCNKPLGKGKGTDSSDSKASRVNLRVNHLRVNLSSTTGTELSVVKCICKSSKHLAHAGDKTTRKVYKKWSLIKQTEILISDLLPITHAHRPHRRDWDGKKKVGCQFPKFHIASSPLTHHQSLNVLDFLVLERFPHQDNADGCPKEEEKAKRK